MLRLERMELSGFKSFPDRTVVEFPDGITAVVGPNGCGKSNVADAIQWVLGEQSARALRGTKMEDVIFNGTQERGPGGMAEVTLHMVSRKEPQPGGRARVTLTRRLYRSGESEYLVDGRKARLADVRDILDEVRAGVRTYAIIDQAQVASFVVSKPKERRIFIEEAAGIASYKGRRRLAELKLEATRANLLRIDDILREVESRRRSLQRQASVARRARRIDDEHRGLRTYWFATRGKELGRLARDLGESLAVARREADHLDAERLRVAGLLAGRREALEAAHAARDAARSAVHRARLDEERLARDVDAALARAAALEDEAGRQEGEGRRLDEERQARREEAERLSAELAAADARLVEIEAQLATAREHAGTERQALDAGQAEAHRLERAHYDALHRRADLAAKLSAAREAAVREERRAEEAAAARERLATQLAEAKEALAAAEAEVRRSGEEADRLVAAVQEARHAEEAAARALDEARTEDARLQAELGQRAGEKAALDSLAVRLAGAEASRAVLEHARAGRLSASNVVADLLSVDVDVEAAAEAFLADALPAVVVESAAEVVRGAQLGVAGRVSFLPLDAPPASESAAHDDLPHELVEDPRVRGRLGTRLSAGRGPGGGLDGALTHRLADAVLVDSLDTALELHRRFPRWNFLSPEGHVVHRNGLVTIEPLEKGKAQRDGLLARARRRDQLAREVADLEQRRGESAVRLEQARASLVEAQAGRRTAEERLADSRRVAATARAGWEQSGREVARLERELALAGTVREAAERGRDEARARAAGFEGDVTAAETDAAGLRTALDEARERVRVREDAVREASAALGALNSERSGQFERRAAVARDLNRLEREVADLAARTEGSNTARGRALEEAATLRARVALGQEQQQRIAGDRAAAEEQAAAADGEVEARAADVRRVEEQQERVVAEWEGARARREQLALSFGRTDSDLEHLLTACREELAQEPEQLSSEAPADADPALLGDEKRLAAHITDLRERRERLGPVNLLAETEFEELSTRFDDLSKQRDDLVQSVEELTGSIRRMDRESRERFVEAFEAVRTHFREQFALLFRGGRGDLVLDDENNPLECGVEILCQPPGKKLQTVSLLSGGEKALAATAVLFSIFRYQPPPFCLLDEVDAPLDDANVGRFTDAVRSFATNTQFILITHNKRSMEMADILYGVTMPEAGISRLMSMTLD